jgi:HAE1 family hydrophobic/amphiphilic exporter-1
LLGWGLNRPKTVLALALGSFLMSFVLMKYVGSEFVPQPDNGELNVQFYTPVGSSLNLTQRKAEQVEKALREFPEVVFTYTTVNTGIAQGKNYGTTFIKLTNRKTREKNIKELTPLLRERLQQIAGITITQIGQGGAVSSGKPVQISLLGPDNGVLAKYAQDVMDIMARQAYFVDIDTSSKPAKPTLALTVKRELAADQGVGVNRINDAVRPLLAGEIASTWLAPDGENYDVTVRLPAGERDSPNDLSRLYVSSSQLEADGSPKMVALREVVDFNATVGPSQINRKALTREILITANVNGMATGTASNALKAELEALNLPPGYRFNFGGSSKDIAETLSFAAQALALAVIFIYLILASQFGSFTQPIAIMVSLPLALIGVILALLLWRSTLNMFSIIGFIMLMGLVTKNAILLVDFVNQALKGGMELREALLNAAEVRLRPILMTTLAMIFGMLPLAVGMGEGSEQRAPMAHAVIGGVITSTLLTLIVVPVIYAMLHRLTHKKNNTTQRQAI